MNVNLCRKFKNWHYDNGYRYLVSYSGRGTGKSYTVATLLLLDALIRPLRILCAREIQLSLSDSVHKLLCDRIGQLGLESEFHITRTSITSSNGSEFIFKGLRSDPAEIKSMEGIDVAWCFPAGTLVDGKPIESIKVGDKVWSYNHSTHKLEKRCVLRTFKHIERNSLYELTYAGSCHITGTANHPIFTQRGYVPLNQVKAGDYVYASKKNRCSRVHSLCRRMWGNYPYQYQKPSSEMDGRGQNHVYRLCPQTSVREDEDQQPYVQSRVSYKDTIVPQTLIQCRPLPQRKQRWQWERIHQISTNSLESFRQRMVGRVNYTNWTCNRLPLQFQSRPCQHLLWFDYRSGWGNPQRKDASRRRPEEGRVLTKQRVDCVKVQEQRSSGQPGCGTRDHTVYNLEVEGNNNYFANGLLVHNCEEASNISKASWDILVPTIRKPGSQIWCTFNPARKEDWVYQMFVANTPPKNAMVVPLTIEDNPEFPDVLREEMEECMARDYDAYRHIWLGECVTHSNACVFKGHFVVRECPEFTTEHPYYGTDFGFSSDANTCVECYVKDNTLFITKENYGVGVDIDKLPAFYDKVMKNRRFTMYGDCARPETISYLQKQGFNIKPCKKWKGCIEDRVEFIKHFKEVVIDPKCVHAIEEFNKYSYKTDRTSGDILPEIEDANNHIIDGLSYAIQDLIMQKKYVKISSNMLTKRR